MTMIRGKDKMKPLAQRVAGMWTFARWIGALAIVLGIVPACQREEKRLAIGSKNFTEQVILAEIVAQHLEARTSLPVERRVNLGGTLICHQALRAGEIDLYVEYTGTALTAILDQEPASGPDQVYRRVADAYREQFDLEWTEALGFNNTFAIVVRGEDARRLGLKTISDSAPHAPGWRAGFGYEFIERPDGFAGLAKTYGLAFGQPPRTMELGLIYRALIEKQVDFVAGNSTDGALSALDLTMLEDDRHYFPPYEAAPVVHRATLERHPKVREALRELGGKISEEEMQGMNGAVDGEGRDVKQVASEFLAAKGLGGRGVGER
jgi:osmoprotectant transport system substrate-binding protein